MWRDAPSGSLRFASVAVISLWRDLHLQERDYAGCTMEKARQVPGLDNVESAGSWQVFRYGRR